MNVRFILTFILKSGKYNFLKNCFFYLRFQRVHQPHPAHRVTSFQFLGNARRLHHPGQHGVHPFPRPPGQSPTGAGTAFHSKSNCCKRRAGVPSDSVAAYGHTELCTQPTMRLGFPFLRELIGRATVAQHIRIPNRIAVLAHGITGVALYGIDTAILDFFHNTHMVG